ncbi:MAG: ATP-grasp domain-containing protein [Nitriliruptor sp.]
MPRDMFVIALDQFNLDTMQQLREAHRYEFRALLPRDQVLKAETYDFDQLVADADAQLRAHDGPVDGIVTWWDFPSSALVPALTELWDLYGPSLQSVLSLEHKYWSRLVQRAVAAEHVPPYAVLDPFDDGALSAIQDQGLDFPFWLKPVKSVGSYLGFRIESAEEFAEALATIRENIGEFGAPFAQALDRVDLPPDIAVLGAQACIAEGIIGGRQCTLEGYVSFGETTTYGVIDSHREPGSSTFRGYQYPSSLPTPIQRRMAQIADDVIRQSGLDHACFNIEFFYDQEAGQLWLLEVNTRLSQSHCDLFAKVDGASSQRAMLDVALGRQPRMPYRQGEFAVAGKFFLRAFEDGLVRSVPSEDDIAAVIDRFPGTRIEIDLTPGTHLSDLKVQESYSFELGRVYLGADDTEQLDERFDQIRDMLPFDIDTSVPAEEGSSSESDDT